MTITAKELAKKLNLSEAAISMALNNKPGVSTATHIRVVDAAKKYGYDFTRITEFMESNATHGTINFIIYKKNGAVVSDTPFFSQLSEGIDNECHNCHYNLSISYLYDHDDIENRLNEIIDYKCSGIILLGTEMIPADFSPFSKLTMPLVVLDTYFDTINCNFVLINNSQGAFQATSHLIKQCKNQPGYLHSSYAIGNFNERANGFYHAIRANGMSTSKSLVHYLTPSMDGAYADMNLLLDNGEEPASCYFADNDLIAAGAMKAFREHGYNIPNDISIIGFDDLPICNYIEPMLTTIQVPKQYMGQMAVNRLIELIHTRHSCAVKIEIATKLINRKSVI